MERRAGSEREQSRKPLVLVLGNHGPEDLHHLDPFREAIVTMLESPQKGRIAIFVEDNSLFYGNSTVTANVERGFLPSDALASLSYATVYGGAREATREAVQRYKEETHFTIKDPFTAQQYAILDAISEEYPGRLRLIPERVGSRLISFNGDSIIAHGMRKIINHATEGDYHLLDVGYFKELAEKQILDNRVRERYLFDTISSELSTNGFIGGVGYFGYGHAAIKRDIDTSNTNVRRVFPDAENGRFTFSPYEIFTSTMNPNMERYNNYGEKEFGVTVNHARIALAQIVVWERLSRAAKRSREKGVNPMSEQQARRKAWAWTGDFTIDDANAFERAIQDRGISQAIREVAARAK